MTIKVVDGDIDEFFTIISDPDYIVQKIKNRLLVFKGEWFLNRTLGLPYFQDILEKQDNLRYIQVLFSNEILKINGITDIVSLEIINYNSSNREIVINFRCIYQGSEINGGIIV